MWCASNIAIIVSAKIEGWTEDFNINDFVRYLSMSQPRKKIRPTCDSQDLVTFFMVLVKQ